MNYDNDLNEIKIRHAVIIYLITIAILIIVWIFMLSNSKGEVSSSNIDKLSLLAGILLFIMLIYRIKPSKERINLLYEDFKKKLNKKEIAQIFVFLTCLSAGGYKLSVDLIYLISPSFANECVNDVPLTINSLTDYLICFIILVILSPVIDELTFRYVLFKRLSKKFNTYIGLIVSSIIFSALSSYPEMVGTLALGIINCILYVKYENIFMPIFLYFINSLLYMLVFIPLMGFKTGHITLTLNNIIMNAVLGTILFIIGIIFFIRFLIKNKVYLKSGFWGKQGYR